MDEQKPTRAESLVELIELVLEGAASDQQERELRARLLASAEDRRLYLHRLNLHSALRRQFAFDAEAEAAQQVDPTPLVGQPDGGRRGPRVRLVKWQWAVAAAAAVVVLIIGFLALRPDLDSGIAIITELNGAVIWTGDGGQVVRDLEVGSPLRGGTLESLSADSWSVLTFRDGSTVTISGQSVLTVSESGQKELYLREGSLSASVTAQPHGRPMLIRTPTAKLEVLGTQLNVDAERTSTMLQVNDGRVSVTRLADGSVVEVATDQQLVVSASRHTDLKAERRPHSVRSWRSSLPSGAIYGSWLSGPRHPDGGLRTAPMLLDFAKKPVTLHLAAISVSRCPAPPVLLTSGGRFRVRGRIEVSGDVYFGLTTKHVKGGFAGKYVAVHKAQRRGTSEESLDMELDLGDFRPQEKEFKQSPIGLELVDWSCFTYNVDAGLSITSVELLPAAASGAPRPQTTQPQPLPILDIWTAAAQGNLEALKRHLAAGAEIDAPFIAPGIPASGATPLHLAVLCDQGDVAQFLIERRADLNAKARDEHGGTPLHWAAALGRVAMARRLMEAGADVNARDNHGYTPLDATRYDGETQKAAKLKIAELLRQHGGRTGDTR